jgi:hypothetical protein
MVDKRRRIFQYEWIRQLFHPKLNVSGGISKPELRVAFLPIPVLENCFYLWVAFG